MSVTYVLTDKENAPAKVFSGEHYTDVWMQKRWREGEYAQYINKNGCGHCSVAMALSLNGVSITPHEEFSLCRKMWGEPKEGEEGNFLSVSGIVKIIKSFGIAAEYFGVKNGAQMQAAEHIESVLSKGRQVIIWSHPTESFKENPFSKREHYVLAAGIDESGKILVANTSEHAFDAHGVHLTDRETISRVLYEGSESQDFTWGRIGKHEHNAGYVVVG